MVAQLVALILRRSARAYHCWCVPRFNDYVKIIASWAKRATLVWSGNISYCEITPISSCWFHGISSSLEACCCVRRSERVGPLPDHRQFVLRWVPLFATACCRGATCAKARRRA
jgi:hypothetical protein